VSCSGLKQSLLIHCFNWEILCNGLSIYAGIYIVRRDSGKFVIWERSFWHDSRHICSGSNFGNWDFLVNFYGLTLGSFLLLLSTLISDELENFYPCYNLQSSIYYRPFSWRYYPKWYFSTQNGLLLCLIICSKMLYSISLWGHRYRTRYGWA